MNPQSNPRSNLGLIPSHRRKNKSLMSEPSPSSSLHHSIPRFAAPLQTLLPRDLPQPNIPLIRPPRPRRNRSGEIARFPRLNQEDELHFHHAIRKARITFESLRISLNHERAPYHRAATLMLSRGLWQNHDKRIVGPIPGVNVGGIFFYRNELCITGLHGQLRDLIDYIPASASENGEPVATSIIVSGGCEGDSGSGNELIYTGHGGHESGAQRRKRLEAGNLALERSMTNGIEIRVIRSITGDSIPTKKVYVYDGLYKVVERMADGSRSGFGACKFRLLRISGQEEMGSLLIARAKSLRSIPLTAKLNGYLSMDISGGKEKFPVLLYNDIDELNDPMWFDYVTRPSYELDAYEHIFSETRCGCECVNGCRDQDCYCATLNGGELPYDTNRILKRGRPVVYECGTWCKCPPSCRNRVSQGGLRSKFEVFRNLTTEWSVRCLDFIRAGSFLFEINGMVTTRKKLKDYAKEKQQYLILPNSFPSKWREWGDVSDVFRDYNLHLLSSLPKLRFAIDVSDKRSVASYLSHRETLTNVFVQLVLHDHNNVAYPHLMVFASENIPPLQELSIDYGRRNPLALTM